MRKTHPIFFLIFLLLLNLQSLFADQLSQEDCDKKREGWYYTGIPLLNYTSDTGVGFGVRIYLYNNGIKGQEYFCNTPYLTQMYAQLFMTSGGYSCHELHWYQFHLFGTRLRLQSSFIYESNSEANYFGVGSTTTRNHLTSATGTSYNTYLSYNNNFLETYSPPGEDERGYFQYNKYQFYKPTFYMDLYGQMLKNVTCIVGFRVSWTDVWFWDNKRFSLNGHRHTAEHSLLREEHPRGYNGGWTNTIRFGIAWNTVDFEPDPKKGFNIDYSFETSQSWFGSDYQYYRNTFGGRYYITFFESVTLASRAAYTIATGNIPFYEMSEFPFPNERQSGLGGNRTLRGYKEDRFVAKTMTLFNLEARIRLFELKVASELFEFQLIGFYDTGNAYGRAGDPFAHPRWDDYKHTVGGGCVVAWNQATIIHFYYAWSPEDTGIYINFNHALR